MKRAIDLVASQQWMIQPDMLDTIEAIALRENEDIEAVAAKVGRPLDNTRTVTVRDGVAVIPIIGPIFRYANLFTRISGATSLQDLATDFSAADEDRSIKRIILEVDSPGGMAAGISEFAEMVRNSETPVTAYVSSTSASAAYWITAAADDVVISDTAMLGSIGTVISYEFDKKDEERFERGKIISDQSPLKQADPRTETGRSEYQRVVNELSDVFIAAVAKYRGVDVETVLTDFGQGGVLVGEAAVKAGMADRLGSLESLIAGFTGGNQTRGITMSDKDKKTDSPEIITREVLAEQNPALLEALLQEGVTEARSEGMEAGAKQERERIQAVEQQLIPGHESLIASLKYDGKTTGEQAAVAVLQSEKQKRENVASQMKEETPAAVGASTDSDEDKVAADSNLPVEERCKTQWEKSADIRAEFGTLEAYTAYERAVANGQIKVLGGKK